MSNVFDLILRLVENVGRKKIIINLDIIELNKHCASVSTIEIEHS